MILVASWTGSLFALWGILCITGCLFSTSLYPEDTEAALFLICDSNDGSKEILAVAGLRSGA